MKSVYIAGSFKNLDKTKVISDLLSKEDIKNDYSKSNDEKGIDGCLKRIEDNDILLINNPDGTVGKSVVFDLGYAIALKKEIYSLSEISDPPISHMTKGVISKEDLITKVKKMKIEFAKPTDLTSCKAFDFDYVSSNDFKNDIESRRIVLAKTHEKVIGYLRLKYLWYITPFVELVIVDKEYRGKGIGKSLLQFTVENLKKDGKNFLLTSSQSDEPGPNRWNKSAGFRKVGSIETLHEGGAQELFYRIDF